MSYSLFADRSTALLDEDGARILSFARDGVDVLRAATSAEAARVDPRQAACFPCAPWFGRLHGGLAFGERRFELAPNFPACDPDHALHGDAWLGRWEIVSHKERSLSARFAHIGSTGRFPFTYVAAQSVSIDQDYLSIALGVKNAGEEDMPAGLALHPYFPRGPKTRLAFGASGLWTPGLMGGGAPGPLPDGLDFSGGAPLPTAPIDHTFTGFSGAVLIDLGDIIVRLVSAAPALHMFAPEGEPYFCLEPTTHLPGDFGRDVLAPGQRMHLTMRIETSQR